MSHFICEHCDTLIVDSPRGYTTGCPHYPTNKKFKPMTRPPDAPPNEEILQWMVESMRARGARR